MTLKSKELPEVVIYSDGGAEPNPGRGGYGVILTHRNRKKELSQGYRHTTNNRMELMGVITGLEALKTRSKVRIFTDSRYVVDGIEKGWARKWKAKGWYRTKTEKAINADLWARLLELLEKHEVNFFWVRGHDGHAQNERCDTLATMALNRDNLKEDSGFIPNAHKRNSSPGLF